MTLGVDFSGVALEQARSSSARLLPAGRSEFRVGTLVATGLPAAVADGLMCVDAIQFADPPLAALHEFRRLLASGCPAGPELLGGGRTAGRAGAVTHPCGEPPA